MKKDNEKLEITRKTRDNESAYWVQRSRCEVKKLFWANLIAIITTTLTWPDINEGFFAGLSIALKCSVIYLICAVFVFPKGFAGIYKALVFLKVPEKLRVLILLTLRGIFILKERFSSALISLKLRAPQQKKIAKIKSFTYVTGSVLLQAAEHSEKMERAIKCRGGFKGFNSIKNEKLEVRNENSFESSKSLLQIS